MDFAGLVVLITGASKGIGKCLAEILHEYGATVIGIYNNTPINNVLFDTYKCDISKEEEIINLFQYIKEKHEKLDVLINCAALCIDDDIYDKSKEDFMKVLEVNLVGTFLMCKYGTKIMDKGVIINISSTDATDTFSPLSMDYAASKAGVENLTKNLAERFPNLKVCALAPNWVNTDTVLNMDKSYLASEMQRVGQDKLLSKEEVALKIIEIIINDDDYISGEIIRMSGMNE